MLKRCGGLTKYFSDRLPPGVDSNHERRELLNVSLSTQDPYPQEHYLSSLLVDFVVKFALNETSACQDVLKAGFLDLLLCMYACNFENIYVLANGGTIAVTVTRRNQISEVGGTISTT